MPTVGRYLRKAALKCNLFYRCFADKKAQPLRALSSNNFDSQLGLITNRCLGNERPKSPFSRRNISEVKPLEGVVYLRKSGNIHGGMKLATWIFSGVGNSVQKPGSNKNTEQPIFCVLRELFFFT